MSSNNPLPLKDQRPLDARDLPSDAHRKLRLAASWLGITMREFLALAIDAYVEKRNVPEEIFQPVAQGQKGN